MRALDLLWQELKSELFGKVQRGRVAVESAIRIVEHQLDQDRNTEGVRLKQVSVVSEIKPRSDRRSGGTDSDWTHA
jgi:hypothetical protein